MFLENLKGAFSDFLRPNYFNVTFSGNIFGEREFGFLARAATYPFMTYNTTTVFYNNLPRHFVNQVDYDPIPFEFMVDDGLKVLTFFDSWRKLVMNDGSRTFNYKEEYSGNIEIELLNGKQYMRAKAVILDAYPVNIDNIALAADANDQIMTLNVSFRYDDVYYEFDDGLSIAAIRDTIFGLAQGTIGTGIDFIKDGIESATNKIPSGAVKNIFGGTGMNKSGFPATEEALAVKSKEVFSGTQGSGGAAYKNAISKAKTAAGGAFNTATKSAGINTSTVTSALSNPSRINKNVRGQINSRVRSFAVNNPATSKAKSMISSKIKSVFSSVFG